MTQQSQTKIQRITMLLALLALVVIIAKNVSAGTACIPVQSLNSCKSDAKSSGVETAADINDIPWQPVISMIW